MTTLDKSISELERTLGQIKTHFLYSEELSRKVMKALNQDALANSNQLEIDTHQPETLQRIQTAWDYTIEHFKERLNEDLIIETAQRIYPANSRYRIETAFLTDIKGNPDLRTNPVKIDREMSKLITQFNGTEQHPIIKAAEFHLYFVFIHPFSDGNGRTARLLQNAYLFYNNFPPAIISHTERNTYLNHIEDARKSFKQRNGQEEMFTNQSYPEYRFFEYILDKIKSSAERLSKKIARQRKYSIELGLRGAPNTIYGIRNDLRQSFSAQRIISQIETHPKRRELEIITCATPEWLTGALERYKDRSRNLKWYEIKETTHQ